jgi:Holliday junction resolvase
VREKQVEQHLVKRVSERGGYALKFTSPSRRSVPDRVCVLPGGKLIFVELKAPGELPTEAQVREHQRLRVLGHIVLVLDSKLDVDYWFDTNCRFWDAT